MDPEVENEDDPLDLPPDDEPLLEEPLVDPDIDPDPEPDPEPEPEPDPEDDPLEPLWAVAGMSLWTQTPSARSVFVPGMWMATVRVGASIRTTESTSSSFMCSSIRKSPGWMNSADAKPHSSPRRTMNGCSGVAFRRRLMTMKPWCSPRRMLATRATTGFAPCRPWCESQLYWARYGTSTSSPGTWIDATRSPGLRFSIGVRRPSSRRTSVPNRRQLLPGPLPPGPDPPGPLPPGPLPPGPEPPPLEPPPEDPPPDDPPPDEPPDDAPDEAPELMPLLAPDDAPLDIPLLPEPDEPEPLEDPEPLDEPDPLLDDPLEGDPDEDDPPEDIDPEELGMPLLEPDDPEGMVSVVPLLDGVCVVPGVLLVKAPVV